MNPDQIEQLLTAYALGDLDADTARTVEAHLEHSESSRQTLSEIRETLGVLQRALQTPLPAGVDTLAPARRAAVLAPPEAEAAASRPLPLPMPWYTGWLRMAATLALTGGAVWIGVRQFAGESDRALRSEVDVPGAPMDIALVDESELAPPAKPVATQPAVVAQTEQVASDWDEAAARRGEAPKELEEARQVVTAAKGGAPAENLQRSSGADGNARHTQKSYRMAAKDDAWDTPAKAGNAPPAAAAPLLPLATEQTGDRIAEENKEREQARGFASPRRELSIQMLESGQVSPVTEDGRTLAEGDTAGQAEPMPAKAGSEPRPSQIPPVVNVDSPAQSRQEEFKSDHRVNENAGMASKAGPISAPGAPDGVEDKGARAPSGSMSDVPSVQDRFRTGQQFDGDALRNAAISGYSQSASREAAQFAALDQNLTAFNAVGGRTQVNTSLYPGVRARPGSVGADTMGSLAKSKLASLGGRDDSAAGAVFQFGFVHPVNLAAMLEETIAGGRIDRAEIGAQPERWAASFPYAVSGRAMGDMRAGVRRIASPEDGHEVLVVMVDSGEDPVAVSMRVVLRPDAASGTRLIGYGSNVTLIPGDYAPPGSLAVAVIDLENPRAGTEPLGRLEVSWSTPDGQGGRETLPLQDAGLGEADAVWAAAMAMTADAMRRGDEEAQQAWGRIVASHLRNRPGTQEARVVEALRRILPASVPVPAFRKS